ncbi:MAG: DUF4845 domain-containing protein, partial [Steroidobacteraceae bacterium]
LIGWLVLLTPLAICLYTGLRLAPVYLNYMKVSHTLDEVSRQFEGGGASVFKIQTSISKHFEIDSVNYPTVQDVTIQRSGTGYHVEAAYVSYAPLFGNIQLRVAFDKAVHVSGGG